MYLFIGAVLALSVPIVKELLLYPETKVEMMRSQKCYSIGQLTRGCNYGEEQCTEWMNRED